MKVFVSIDEVFPVFTLSKEDPEAWFQDEIELSEEEFEEWKAAQRVIDKMDHRLWTELGPFP